MKSNINILRTRVEREYETRYRAGMKQAQEMKTITRAYPLLPAEDRLSVWEKIRGIWKHRIPEPTQELKKIRSGWNRRLPKIN